MNTIMSMVGLYNLAPSAILFILAMAVSAAIAAGWLADVIMDGMSFGIIVNSILVLLGALLTVVFWRIFRMPFHREYGIAFIMIVCLGGTGFLLGCAYLRRFA